MAYRKPLRKKGKAWTTKLKNSFTNDYDLYLKDELSLNALAFLYALKPNTIRGLAHEWLLPYKNPPMTKEEIQWLKDHVDEFVNYADAADKLNAIFGNGRHRTSANRTFKKFIAIKKK